MSRPKRPIHISSLQFISLYCFHEIERISRLFSNLNDEIISLTSYFSTLLCFDFVTATHGCKLGDAILAEEKHQVLYTQLVNDYPVQYIAGGATLNSIRVAQWMLQVKDCMISQKKVTMIMWRIQSLTFVSNITLLNNRYQIVLHISGLLELIILERLLSVVPKKMVFLCHSRRILK
jgi:hypothetical protein